MIQENNFLGYSPNDSKNSENGQFLKAKNADEELERLKLEQAKDVEDAAMKVVIKQSVLLSRFFEKTHQKLLNPADELELRRLFRITKWHPIQHEPDIVYKLNLVHMKGTITMKPQEVPHKPEITAYAVYVNVTDQYGNTYRDEQYYIERKSRNN